MRQGSFIGAGVNTVTRSGTNRLSGSFYHRFRDQDWVGTEAAGQVVNPGTFTFRNTGGWASGPILKNKWFAFGNYEDQMDKRPLTTFRANTGGEPIGGQVDACARRRISTALSTFLKTNFDYDTGPFDGISDETPAKRFLLRSDYNINNSNKVSFRYNYLDSFSDTGLSSSTSALRGRTNFSTGFLTFQNSNYQILENIRSGIGEWNWVIGNSMANSFQSGYTTQDESRAARGDHLPAGGHLRGRHQLHLVRRRAVHLPQRAGLQHVPAPGQLHQVHQPAHADLRRVCGEVPLGQHLHELLPAECLSPTTRWPTSTPTPTATWRTRIARSSPITLSAFQISYSNIPGVTAADAAARRVVHARATCRTSGGCAPT